MESLLSYYKDKKVFVTGHTGFKGAWFISWLHILGARVKGYALAPQRGEDIFHIIQGNKLCESVIGDILDKDKLAEEIRVFEPDFVFHLAAQSLVRLSYNKPLETFDVNVIGTANVLNAVRSLSKPCSVVVITTDKVYENNEWHYPYREVDALGGYDPYSASKAAAEIVVNSFRRSFFHPSEYSSHNIGIASARAGNVIGGGDWSEDRIIPDIVRSLSDNRKILIRNPHAIRPWQFVLEPLYGYLMLGIKLSQNPLQFSGPFNFGPLPNDFLPVSDLVDIAIKHWGSGAADVPEIAGQFHEAGVLKLDISKSMDLLKWVPKLSSNEAISWTIEWYRNSGATKDFTFAQIDKYQSL